MLYSSNDRCFEGEKTEVWCTELTWYSPCATHRIFLDGSEHGHGIYGFRADGRSYCKLNKVLSITFWTEQLSIAPLPSVQRMFLISLRVTAQFELVKYKFPNKTTLHIPQCDFQITHVKKQCTCKRKNYHNTNNHSEYMPRIELLWSRAICVAN